MISFRGVRFGYTRETTAFACDALDVGRGVTLLLGPNGAGKSTFLKLASGVEHPTAGRIAIGGHDLWHDEVAARAALAYVPEHPDLTPYATVGEVLGLVCRLRGRPLADGDAALDSVGLGGLGQRSVRELSMGQRRRAVLAAAFIGEPSTLLLDEPLEAMDRAMRASVLGWIARAKDGGATIVVATHEIEPFAEMAEAAVVAAAGSVSLVAPLPAGAADRMRLLEGAARGETVAVPGPAPVPRVVRMGP